MPTTLGRYAVRRRIGSGGFATVWLAYDEQLDSPVAVKVLADNWSEDSEVRRRFVEEGRFLRRVDSPHVVSVYDAGELDDGRPYLVMTFADQGSLADRLGEMPLALDEGVDIIRQIGLGLAALHRRDVLHRDVKPGNVLFRTDESQAWGVRAMLGDLGLGKSLDISSRLTMIAGTPAYVAPEQARGEPLDSRADQFALAAVSHLVLTGRPPYSHGSLAAAAQPPPAPPLSGDGQQFPEAVEAVVGRALSLDREERWPDVLTFVDTLGQASAGQPPSGRSRSSLIDPDLTRVNTRPSASTEPNTPTDPSPPVAPRRRRGARIAAVGLLSLVALGAGAGGGYYLQREDGGATVTVEDDSKVISATVPEDWATTRTTSGWWAPESPARLPALSVGKKDGTDRLFAGFLEAGKLPRRLPDHDCRTVGDRDLGDVRGNRAVTVVHSECPGGGVIIERVVQVTANRQLWVEVASDTEEEATRVVDSVRVRV